MRIYKCDICGKEYFEETSLERMYPEAKKAFYKLPTIDVCYECNSGTDFLLKQWNTKTGDMLSILYLAELKNIAPYFKKEIEGRKCATTNT